MATPYLQFRYQEVSSTQDRARELRQDLPVLVIAAAQTRGRGRSGAEWLTAPRALAASVAAEIPEGDSRPFSLMAGVAATRAMEGLSMKWPNDILRSGLKVGGILVERSGPELVVGMGVNLWWPDAPDGIGALFEDDPGESIHAQIAALWGAELLALCDGSDWPEDEYRASCSTLGEMITWEPGGSGRAVDVDAAGALLVDTGTGRVTLHSGAVRHVRP